MAEELGLVYEHIALPYQGGATRTPEFLALNPNGRIPALDDDGVVVWESMACALYLAGRFQAADGSLLAAQTPGEQADILRWSFWVVTECEKDALAFLMHSRAMPPERRKLSLAEETVQHLQQRPYLAGERFTVADVCVASVLAWVKDSEKLMAACPHIQDWLQRCLARPAFAQLSLLP